jgi:PKD repeat protein
MKKLFTFFALIVSISLTSVGQYGYFPDFFGDLTYKELTNPSNSTLVGATINQVGASDFALDNNLYAICGADNNLYQIDTSNASATSIGNVPPPGGEFWTGMACDPTDGTIYICSTDGSSNSFYTIDLTNVSVSLIGTNSVEDGAVGIAFDGTGQMYAIYLVRKFYMIDKADATATFVGNLNTAVSVLPHHGLDFDPVTQTMFMVSYNAFSFNTELWTVDISTGANTLVGPVGIWTGSLAVEPVETITAGFSADNTEICEDVIVSFSDESSGNPIEWLWTFEGGLPATSTEQYPQVLYSTPGEFDVTLEVSDGTISNTLLIENYIQVLEAPAPDIAGADTACTDHIEDYSTIENAGNTYDWFVDGGTIINGAGTHQVTVEWGEPGTGYLELTEDNGDCSSIAVFDVIIDECTVVDNHSLKEFSMYPNPANNAIYIDLPQQGEFIVKIVNTNGHTELTKPYKGTQSSELYINIDHINNGIYFLILIDNKGEVYYRKLVKSD